MIEKKKETKLGGGNVFFIEKSPNNKYQHTNMIHCNYIKKKLNNEIECVQIKMNVSNSQTQINL